MQSQLANISEDLEDIVRLHMQAFPGFFMTAMGVSFVREYYRTVLEFPDNISLVVIERDRKAGFVVGFGNPKAFYSWYRSKRLRLLPLIVRAILLNPSLLGRVIVNLKRVSSVEGSNVEVELSSIGVDPYLMELGVGKALIASFLHLASKRGYQSVYLTTDTQNNERVNRFYEKQGFILEKTFWSGSRQMNLYRILV
jgi:ribosomal protein S18 acetylase RimI-like enzyme